MEDSYIDLLFFIHIILFITYLAYALLEGSDSIKYYDDAGSTKLWFELWGTDSKFIQFLGWPFVSFLGLSYNAVALIFAYIGFQGVMLFYLTLKENIYYLKPLRGSFTIAEWVFLLPNIHFWSASLGKGSVMLFSLGMLIYGFSRFKNRKGMLILGTFLIYMIRPHIVFSFLLAVLGSTLITSKGVKPAVKIAMIVISLLVIYLIYDDLLKYTGSSGINIFDSAGLDKRANELYRSSGSGVDINNYNQVEKLFTFWFRPLFIDGRGVLGIILSVENLIVLIMAYGLFKNAIKSWKHWTLLSRTILFTFLINSIALAQVMANLGIANRQKAQVMPLFFIAYCYAESLRLKRKKTLSTAKVKNNVEPIYVGKNFRLKSI